MRRQTSAKNRLNRLLLTAVICLAGMMTSWAAQADRIKDIADIAGVRGNQLVGYGLVVGLDGTGASSQFAQQSIISML
ncbi:MAG: hypothetical protein COZ79_04780, partial [Hydrogenophilales bacterium CG_4_8_14_3_um_filter_62_83]